MPLWEILDPPLYDKHKGIPVWCALPACAEPTWTAWQTPVKTLPVADLQCPVGVQIFSICMDFFFWKNYANCMLCAPARKVGAPNSGKFWIRHCNLPPRNFAGGGDKWSFPPGILRRNAARHRDVFRDRRADDGWLGADDRVERRPCRDESRRLRLPRTHHRERCRITPQINALYNPELLNKA